MVYTLVESDRIHRGLERIYKNNKTEKHEVRLMKEVWIKSQVTKRKVIQIR